MKVLGIAGYSGNGKTTLVVRLIPELKRHIARARTQYEEDLKAGYGWVELPHAFEHKQPSAGREWAWQWVFPATRTYREQSTGQGRRLDQRYAQPVAAAVAAALAALHLRTVHAVHAVEECVDLEHQLAKQIERGAAASHGPSLPYP